MTCKLLGITILGIALAMSSCEKQNTTNESIKNVKKFPIVSDSNAVSFTKTISLTDGSSITWIQDNEGEKLNPRDLFSDVSDSLYNSLNLPQGIPASVSTFLLKSDSEYILFDAGLGAFGGQLFNHLNKLNVNPDSIKKIYLTHLHVDHINGLVNKTENGFEKAFKNATIYVNAVEKETWFNTIEKNELQKAILGVYSENLQLFSFGDTLPHNIYAIDAAGHTKGHTAFQKDEILIIGDLIHGFALQINHPEINSNYDMDKEKSIETRKQILDYIKQNNLTMAGMHLPAPGFWKH